MPAGRACRGIMFPLSLRRGATADFGGRDRWPTLSRGRIRETTGSSMITETKLRRVEPDITVLEISGRLNLGNSLITVETSIQRLVEEGSRKLVIDVASLNAIDSSGIGLLVMCSGHIEQHGGRMRIAGAQGAVA